MVDGVVLQVVDTQNEIIRLQAEVIKDLFNTLGQYMCAEELDSLPAVKKINLAAELRKQI